MGDDRVRSGLHLISSVVRAFSEATTDYHLLLETIARMVARTIPDCYAVLVRDADGRLTPAAVHDPDPRVIAAFRSRLGRPHTLAEAPLAADAIENGSLLLPEVDLADLRVRRPGAAIEMLEEIGVRGMLIAPLRSQGQAFGALSILRHDPRHPPLDELDLEIVEDLAGHAALALGTSRLVNQLQAELERRTAAELASTFLDAIIENIPDMVFVKEAERLAFVRFNPPASSCSAWRATS
jgi:GAF domain-containing protein